MFCCLCRAGGFCTLRRTFPARLSVTKVVKIVYISKLDIIFFSWNKYTYFLERIYFLEKKYIPFSQKHYTFQAKGIYFSGKKYVLFW